MATFFFIDEGRIRPAPNARIIKAPDYATVGEAQQILDAARRKAADIVKEAKAAFHQEKRKGYQDGMRDAAREMADQLATMALRTENHYRALEEQTVGLVMEIVRRVLRELDPREVVVAQTKKALGAFKGHKRLTIKVHPAVANTLTRKFDNLIAACPGLNIIDIKATPHMSADHLILESETGIVEASLETQLEAIEEAIRKELTLPN